MFPRRLGFAVLAICSAFAGRPAFAQSRLLTRILVALTYGQGEFRRAEVAALDAGTYAMVIALMDAFGAGTTTRAAWEQAVTAARAAELDAAR